MVECERCGQEGADFLSRTDNKWYHIDCYVLKQVNPTGYNTSKLTWFNCCAVVVIFYLLFYILYWMNQP